MEGAAPLPNVPQERLGQPTQGDEADAPTLDEISEGFRAEMTAQGLTFLCGPLRRGGRSVAVAQALRFEAWRTSPSAFHMDEQDLQLEPWCLFREAGACEDGAAIRQPGHDDLDLVRAKYAGRPRHDPLGRQCGRNRSPSKDQCPP
jgi:hypothetical protein